MRDDPYWTSRKSSFKLIEKKCIKCIKNVSLVRVSFCSNTGSIRNDPY